MRMREKEGTNLNGFLISGGIRIIKIIEVFLGSHVRSGRTPCSLRAGFILVCSHKESDIIEGSLNNQTLKNDKMIRLLILLQQ